MPYIAKVFDNAGTFEVVELRQGTLNDIPQSQVDDWRTVTEQQPDPNEDVETLGGVVLTINPTGTSVVLDREMRTNNIHWSRMRLINYTKDKRQRVERGGLTLANGTKIDTDIANQYEISILKRRGDDGQITFPYRYRVRGNDFIDLTLAQITAADNAIADHIKNAILIEESVISDILAGTIISRNQIDNAAWPS
jgi:hypothetical protein